uniref:uncharacterized protein LOC105352187 n=1 Tax=Fragaria vesca subsp. vesca TaxID=101020 RepID=UPI0005CB6624|nr:PREDICTED: uncharacterized protein LOC105352187 [Fragaria vesca subsp. vesca]
MKYEFEYCNHSNVKLWSLVERQSRLDPINLIEGGALCVRGCKGVIYFQDLTPSKKLNVFIWNKFRLIGLDVDDQPPVTSIPAFTRCCQARLEIQFNTEINLLSHLPPYNCHKDS